MNIKDCGNEIDLSDRHKLRWVLWSVKSQVYKLVKEFYGFVGAGAAFIFLHAIIITITFWFTFQNILYCMNSMTREKKNVITNVNNPEILIVSTIVFLAFYLYSFNAKVGEYSFSVTEALFVSIGLYFVLRQKLFAFSIIVSLAVLNRESGFILLAFWILFNGLYLKNFYKNLYLLLPPIIFTIANLPMLGCLLQDNFLISTSPLPGQVTYHIFFDGLWGFIRGVLSLSFNFLIYLIPSYAAYKWLSKDLIDSTIFRNIILLVGLYALVFIIAAPLNHMSIKFIIVPLICILLSIYIIGLIKNWKNND